MPLALGLNLRHNGVLHERVVFLNVMPARTPRVAEADRVRHEDLGDGLERLVLHVGFAERPNLPHLLQQSRDQLGIDPETASFFIGRETPVPTSRPDLAGWEEVLFGFMAGKAVGAADYFMIPAERVVELGTRVEL